MAAILLQAAALAAAIALLRRLQPQPAPQPVREQAKTDKKP